ncbi:MAG: S-layer homology domain-containing protein, partial [Oscillospiraceae bacterium]|nr:S-layer homology domain-containing protein [Oscillospiraceae bacterium]
KVTPDEGYKLDELTVKDASGKEIELTKNEDGTYSFVQPNGKVTIEAKFAKEVKFADVPENSYYADAVDWAVEQGITNGVDENHFAPDATCTRAQAVTFLWRALGCPEPTATKSEFTDVTDANAFYYKAVLWATENGVTNGIGDGSFGVNGIVNRAQMVTFMARAMNGKANTAESFTDVPDGAFYADAAAWAKENEVSAGIGEGKFGGEIDCLRAQIVTMLYRYFVK